MAKTVRVGVAGWDYPDWQGIVYPAGAGRGFDRLRFIARYVDLVEINSTFYRPNRPQVAESWVRRTRDFPAFRFSAKTHRSWTHDDLPPGLPDMAACLDGLSPLKQAGILAALLVQFPHSFARTDAAFGYLARLADALPAWPLVVELRHRTWFDDDAFDRLQSLALSLCVVDQPHIARQTEAPRVAPSSPIGYLRLHGRNRREWFRSGAGRDARYDYLYDAEEMRGLGGVVSAMERHAEEIIVVQNNHFRGQAVVNALQMMHLLGRRDLEAPETLTRRYPGALPWVTPRRSTLF